MIPGGVYLNPSTDLLNNDKLKKWFIPYNHESIMFTCSKFYYDLTLLCLPFDKNAYTHFCSTILDPQLQQVVDILASNQRKADSTDASQLV